MYKVAEKSKDKHTKVGCVIVGPDNEIRSTGYNSFVRGLDDNDTSRLERPEKYYWIEHAERNAIYNAARIGVSVKGCKIYIPSLPCVECARAIVSSGIVEVHNLNHEIVQWLTTHSSDNYARSFVMFKECGVKIVTHDLPHIKP